MELLVKSTDDNQPPEMVFFTFFLQTRIEQKRLLTMEPSGSDKGFFQEAPALTNQFFDETFQRCYRRKFCRIVFYNP